MGTKVNSELMIRRAVPLDCVNIARALKASWEPSQAAVPAQVDDLRAVEYVTNTLRESFVVVADLSGRLIGVMACTLMRERWSRPDDWFLADEFVVISSAWVTRGVIERLLAEAEAFADQESMPLMLGGSLLSAPLNPILSQRPGYLRLGAQYLRMPHAADEPRSVEGPSSATAMSTVRAEMAAAS